MLALAFGLCATNAFADRSDLELTWYKGFMAVPDVISTSRDTSFISDQGRLQLLADAGMKFPVVVYMHGCTGVSDADRKLMNTIAKQGYLVVAPNSMARRMRPRQCDSDNHASVGGNYFVFDFRQEEINYALQEMLRVNGDWSRWVDVNNLFLMGVSEGGLAVAHYRGDVFKARIITQWTCHGGTLVRGISGPEDTPILAIVRKNDPWYDDKPDQVGDCGAYFGDRRPGSESVVLDQGDKHDVMRDPEMVQKMIGFLNRYNTARPVPPPRRPTADDYAPLR